MTVTAIPTWYRDTKFRSRLEARWAVFFDALKIQWQFEPQGFALPSGKAYLPDFHLPELDLWVEVKGDEGDLRASGDRLAEFAMNQDGNGLLILGPVLDASLGLPQHFVLTRHAHCCGKQILCLHIAWVDMLAGGRAVNEVGFPCAALGNHGSISLPGLRGYGGGKATYTEPGQIIDWPTEPAHVNAYRAARSARFEHGESGAQQ